MKLTRSFVVDIRADVEDGTEILALLVDSVRLPIRSLSLDGEKLAKSEYFLHGTFESVKVHARRFYYDQDYPQKILEEQTYELSGQIVPLENAWLEFSCGGEVKYFDLGPLEKLKSEMHP